MVRRLCLDGCDVVMCVVGEFMDTYPPPMLDLC